MAIILPVFSFSCSSSGPQTQLGKEFTLTEGQTIAINGQDLSINFVKVSADSRCPAGVTCVQAGNAKCDVVFTYKGLEYPVTLTDEVSPESDVVFMAYKVTFSLDPYPKSGTQIAPEDYKLNMTVTK